MRPHPLNSYIIPCKYVKQFLLFIHLNVYIYVFIYVYSYRISQKANTYAIKILTMYSRFVFTSLDFLLEIDFPLSITIHQYFYFAVPICLHVLCYCSFLFVLLKDTIRVSVFDERKEINLRRVKTWNLLKVCYIFR